MVITATILLLECVAREHDRTAVFLWFSGCSSLYRISIMGALSRYYHLFNQNFTGRCNSGKVVHRPSSTCISRQTNPMGTLNKFSLSNADKEQLA